MNRQSKLFSAIVCLLVLAATLFALSSCDVKIFETINCEHEWGEWTVVTEPTCSTEGVRERVCTLDSSHKDVESIAATGDHKYGTAWETDGENHWHVCESCGCASETTAHVWDDGVVTVEPTETSNGEEVFTCEVCEITKKQVLGKLPHTHSLVHTDAKSATCTADGNVEYWYCDGCDKYFSDANGDTQISGEALVVPKSHSYSNEWSK